MWPFKAGDRIEAMVYELRDDLNALSRDFYILERAVSRRIDILEAQVWWDNNAHGYDGHWGKGDLLFHGRKFLREVPNETPLYALSAMPGYFEGARDAAYEAGKLNEQYGYMSLQEWLEGRDD